ncbi:AMMECR1 domain protein [Halobacterium hubeiense]|uniref:AMMECR1 domain protein n=1 Tax=Halobacterium hubeiense TaxID=1407499 RepID=A0A0U5H0L6_9EURY|nr:TIGR00296 family protein [Halobacterium hubeiense]CQH44676.1 AMMECR1 domain protein [Halobacterium hubeiense]
MAEAQSVVLSFEDGARTVELARESVEAFVRNGQREQPGSMRDAFYNRTSAFVRLESTHGRGRLRGCAGAQKSARDLGSRDQQLGHAIVEASIKAASDASCGSEVEAAELPNLRVSVCTVSNLVLTDDPVEDIELGVHGVAIDGDGQHGWMYPTLPVENDWSVFEYLDRTCRKAGLPNGAWEDDDVMVTLFEGQVFRETGEDAEEPVEELTA